MSSAGLQAVFLRTCPPSLRAHPPAESALREAWERGRARFPTVSVEAAEFTAYLAARASVLRERLLVATSDAPPRIAEYTGRGPLHAFLRVAAMRCALNLRRGKAQEAHEGDDAVLRLASPDESPESVLLRERYAPEFQKALRSALGCLTSEEHNLRHLYFVANVSMQQLAQMFQVNRTMVGRWLQDAREIPDFTASNLSPKCARNLGKRTGAAGRNWCYRGARGQHETDPSFRCSRSDACYHRRWMSPAIASARPWRAH